jgi:hypothetical protein
MFGVIKETFTKNLVDYLISSHKLVSHVTPELRTYDSFGLYQAAYLYCKDLPRNIDTCGLKDYDHGL